VSESLEQRTDLPLSLDLFANFALTSTSALRSLTRIGMLSVDRNTALRDLALPGVTRSIRR
jgi:hypothetical protein